MSSTTLNPQVIILTALSVSILLFILLVPGQVVAQTNVVVNGGSGSNAQRQTVTLNSQIRNYLQQLVDKEYNKDPAATKLSREATQKYYKEVERYLASGDAGEAMFVENLELYRAEIRATTTLNTINQIAEEGNICSGFKNEVITQLKQIYIEENARTVAQKNTCQLEQTDENYERFLEGEFREDGIQALYAIIKDPKNSPVGSLLENQQLVEEQANEAEENALLQLEYGDGFKDQYAAGQNVMVCTQREINGIRAFQQGSQRQCRIASPAEVVRMKAGELSQLGVAILTNNDEYSDDVTRNLIESVTKQTLEKGITGTADYSIPDLSQPGGSTGSTNLTTPGGATIVNPNPGTDLADPIPQIPNDNKQPATQTFLVEVTSSLNDVSSSSNPIKSTLVRTLTKLQYQLETVSLIDRTENRHLDAAENPEYREIGCYTLAFPNNFSNERNLTLTEIPETIDAIKRLYVLFIQYEIALANNQPVSPILAEFDALIRNNFAIPNEIDLSGIAYKYNNLLGKQVNSFESQRIEQVNQCEEILNPPEEDDDNKQSTW